RSGSPRHPSVHLRPSASINVHIPLFIPTHHSTTPLLHYSTTQSLPWPILISPFTTLNSPFKTVPAPRPALRPGTQSSASQSGCSSTSTCPRRWTPWHGP